MWQSSSSQKEVPYRANVPMRAQLLELLMQKMALFADDSFLDLARVAIAAFIHSPERAQDMVNRLGQKEGGLLGWIRAAQRDGRLKSGDTSLAVRQLESLVKGMAFWPQVTMGQPKLSPREQRKLASAAVDLFLSHYAV